jgi:hypothetical protein
MGIGRIQTYRAYHAREQYWLVLSVGLQVNPIEQNRIAGSREITGSDAPVFATSGNVAYSIVPGRAQNNGNRF